MSQTREERGREIAEMGQVVRLDEGHYQVVSQSGNGLYDVVSTEAGWSCSCKDFEFRHEVCKHQWAVQFSQALRVEVQRAQVVKPLDSLSCKFCGSNETIKDALRHNAYGSIQRFKCKVCERRFSVNVGFERMRASPQTITSAMQLYFTGESLRSVQKFLRLQGVNVSHVAVLKWIRKYVALMDKYVDKITPQVSDTWRADEVYIKFKGNRKYLFAMMDDETRFWIAQEVSHWKENTDASKLFRKAKTLAGKTPKILITDQLKSYKTASRQEFPTTRHVQDITLSGVIHNNKMERMNGEVRDREKVMRGLKRMDTPILKGVQIYHNFIRPHEGLNGQTPADRAGIKVEGENKWLTLIQNATRRSPAGDSRPS